MGRQCIKKLFDSTPLGQQLLSAAEVEREANVIDHLPNLEGTASSEIRHFRLVTQTKAYRIKWLPFSTVDWSEGKIKFFMTLFLRLCPFLSLSLSILSKIFFYFLV